MTQTAHGASALWEPTIVLPSQLGNQRGAARLPELRLMAAVLEDAIDCIVRYVDARRGRRRREFFEAYHWILSDHREWPFAFVNVCDVLGLNILAVRERVLRFLAMHTAESGEPVRPRASAARVQPVADEPCKIPAAVHDAAKLVPPRAHVPPRVLGDVPYTAALSPL